MRHHKELFLGFAVLWLAVTPVRTEVRASSADASSSSMRPPLAVYRITMPPNASERSDNAPSVLQDVTRIAGLSPMASPVATQAAGKAASGNAPSVLQDVTRIAGVSPIASPVATQAAGKSGSGNAARLSGNAPSARRDVARVADLSPMAPPVTTQAVDQSAAGNAPSAMQDVTPVADLSAMAPPVATQAVGKAASGNAAELSGNASLATQDVTQIADLSPAVATQTAGRASTLPGSLSAALAVTIRTAPPAVHERVAPPVWRIRPRVELREQLDDWAARAGWTLIWDSEYDYLPNLQARFDGEFIVAVTALFEALHDVHPPLYPVLYQGNQVLLVKSQPQQ